jgi:lysophospholipid acyltransferase (LPLAT)-like uncharacterized protein
VIYLASRTGLPIVPVGFGLQHPWRASSWDRFALPRPGSRATSVSTVAIEIPATMTTEEFEDYRLKVEHALCTATEAAEQWAATGRLHTP